MKLGVQFPQAEIGPDAGEVREFVQGVEDLGYHHLQVADHVLGADRSAHSELELPYDTESLFHEPLVLFGFVAACAPKLHLLSGIVILPQRQTALVAKQMAEVDVLAGGRTRFGVSVGWNPVEYDALGMDFRRRGRRIEEQVALLRRLWTEPVVSFSGEFDRISGAGINPLPIQRPIPIWFGGLIERARWRAAVLGDGYVMQLPLPPRPLDSEWPERLEQMREWRRAAGHDSELGLEAKVAIDGPDGAEEWRRIALEWKELGATHLAVRTSGVGVRGGPEHLERLALVAGALRDVVG